MVTSLPVVWSRSTNSTNPGHAARCQRHCGAGVGDRLLAGAGGDRAHRAEYSDAIVGGDPDERSLAWFRPPHNRNRQFIAWSSSKETDAAVMHYRDDDLGVATPAPESTPIHGHNPVLRQWFVCHRDSGPCRRYKDEILLGSTHQSLRARR